jgi:hypothetical protein
MKTRRIIIPLLVGLTSILSCSKDKETIIEYRNDSNAEKTVEDPKKVCFESVFTTDCFNKFKTIGENETIINQNEVNALAAELYLMDIENTTLYYNGDDAQLAKAPKVNQVFYPYSHLNFRNKETKCGVSNNILNTSYNVSIKWKVPYRFQADSLATSRAYSLDLSSYIDTSGTVDSCSIEQINGSNVIPNPILALKDEFLKSDNSYSFQFPNTDKGNIYATITSSPFEQKGLQKIKYTIYSRIFVQNDSIAKINITTVTYLAMDRDFAGELNHNRFNTPQYQLMWAELNSKIQSRKTQGQFQYKLGDLNGEWQAYSISTFHNNQSFYIGTGFSSSNYMLINNLRIENNRINRNNSFYDFKFDNNENAYFSVSSFNSYRTKYVFINQNTLKLENQMTIKEAFNRGYINSNNLTSEQIEEYKNSLDYITVTVTYGRI